MNLLLDTHTLLWWLDAPESLSERATNAIADPNNEVILSAVVVWECRIKEALGKLTLPENFAEVLAAEPFRALDITTPHAHGVSTLEFVHRDPFDRLLVSQARHEGLTLITRDEVLSKYPIDTLW